MNNKLKKYFPMIKSREEIQDVIQRNKRLELEFASWSKSRQDEFLDFTSGARGIKILYDSFFKEIMNPEYHPERLNDLLSVILGMNVRIVQVLPTDSTRLGDETSLVTMDIVVQTEDGALINVEVQKIGYLFPGERSACYSADLLLRQYKRLKDMSGVGRKFNYRNMKPVYTIVFFENSPQVFKKFSDRYIHKFQQKSDTGIEISLLQKYIFISLDNYNKISKNINTKLDAWLTFLGSDRIEDIIQLIEIYPEFKPMYETLYEMCLNIEGVMDMFSRELWEMDKNTELFMIDELEKENREKQAVIDEQSNRIAIQEQSLYQKDNIINEKNALIAELKSKLERIL